MARHRISRCPHCMQQIDTRGLTTYRLGSPFRNCPRCGKEYVDKEYHELAIEEYKKPPFIKDNPLFVICGLFLWACFMAGAILNEQWGFFAFLMMIFAVPAGGYAIYVFGGFKKKKIDREKQASLQRLQDPLYRAKLRAIGYSVPEEGIKTFAQPLQRGTYPGKPLTIIPKGVSENAGSEQYHFENMIEFMTYVGLHSTNKAVIWLPPDSYWAEYKKGYQLFEQGQFDLAIDAYKRCLELNPIGLSARFEICEAYIKMDCLSLAQSTLLEMKDYLAEKDKIARFYRRMGFIETQKGNYEVATACFQYSLQYDNNPMAIKELQYIKSKGGSGAAASGDDPKQTLISANIPILK